MNCCKPACLALAFLVAASSAQAEEIRLTTDGRLKRDPTFVENAKAIVYGVDESRVLIRLMRLPIDGGVPAPLHSGANKTEQEPSFSDDGRVVAFSRCTGNLMMQLIIRNTKSNKEAVIKHKGRGGYCRPRVAPDGSRVLYCFAEKGPQHIYSVDIEAKDKKQLTEGQGINNWPSFSADGKLVAFSSSRSGTYELYTMKPDGSDVKRITTNNSMEIRPQISPDGKRIAFASNRSGNRDIYVVNTDGSGLRRVTTNPERDDYPAWHPDGKRLVYVSQREGRFDLYLVDVPE